MFNISRKRKRQVLGFSIGLFLAVITYVMLSIPANEHFLAKGSMNKGHEDLKCVACHIEAKGNVFQQIQINTLVVLGMRKKLSDFGLEDVDNHKCQGCHDRPNDRHPVHRFKETRFSDARKNIEATVCETCHREHQGQRITLETSSYCVNCHQDTELKNDPLEISHDDLIEKEMWSTCLQCHDFHGNHEMNTAESMKDTIPLIVIREYFEGAASPYADIKKYIADKPEAKTRK